MTAKKWTLDLAHSELQFKVKHLMVSNVTGNFQKFDVQVDSEQPDFSDARISFTAETASINTGNEQRDGHLRSADFFDAEKYPVIEFKSTSFTRVDDDNYELKGDLTMHGETKPVTLSVEFGGSSKDPWGNSKAGFSVSGKIKRTDFGLNWNAALETGGVLVSEEVRLLAEIQLLQTVPQEAEAANA